MELIDDPVILGRIAPLLGGYIRPEPEPLAGDLMPARWIVREWVDYWYIDKAMQIAESFLLSDAVLNAAEPAMRGDALGPLLAGH